MQLQLQLHTVVLTILEEYSHVNMLTALQETMGLFRCDAAHRDKLYDEN